MQSLWSLWVMLEAEGFQLGARADSIYLQLLTEALAHLI